MKTLTATSSFAALVLAAGLAQAETIRTDSLTIETEIVADGLRNPWGLAFLPDGAVLVTEREGNLRIVSRDGKISEPVAGLPEVWAEGQGGLLDVVLSPRFADDRVVYFSFSEPGDGGAGTAVARGRLTGEGASAKLENVETIFSMERKTSRGQHFGSRLVFHPDGTLFVTTGDRGQGERAQDKGDHAGAVLRINVDGSRPADNPDFGSDAQPQLWSKGHRNIQGAAWDAAAGALVTVEHGAKGGDEVNYPLPGKNYGWPKISYGVDYAGAKIGVGQQAEGFEQPVHYWDPSIAPSGLVVYDGEMFPEWKGDLIVGALKFELLSRLDRDESGKVVGEERILEGSFGRIRDVKMAPDGALWLVTDETDGKVVRLSRGD